MLKGLGDHYIIAFEEDMENTTSNEIKFPLLGALEDGETFEYILCSINHDDIEIAILNWLVNRAKLHKNDKVALYIPQLLTDQYQFRKNVSGIVTSITPHEMGGEIYQITVDHLEKQYSVNEFSQQLPIEGTTVDLLIQLIKDSMLLKQGIEVYIKHIIPYFSRLGNYTDKEYLQIKKHFLLDVENHIKKNVSKLKELHHTLESKLTKAEQIPLYIDLETLRENFESEISADLFQIVFNEDNKISSGKGKNHGFLIYISAIKNLEKRLYSNYNQVVLLYLKSL